MRWSVWTSSFVVEAQAEVQAEVRAEVHESASRARAEGKSTGFAKSKGTIVLVLSKEWEQRDEGEAR
jgi:hypothetical protein